MGRNKTINIYLIITAVFFAGCAGASTRTVKAARAIPEKLPGMDGMQPARETPSPALNENITDTKGTSAIESKAPAAAPVSTDVINVPDTAPRESVVTGQKEGSMTPVKQLQFKESPKAENPVQPVELKTEVALPIEPKQKPEITPEKSAEPLSEPKQDEMPAEQVMNKHENTFALPVSSGISAAKENKTDNLPLSPAPEAPRKKAPAIMVPKNKLADTSVIEAEKPAQKAKAEWQKKQPKKKIEARHAEKMHTVARGDNLELLAEKYYGDKSMWIKIYEANKDRIEKGSLETGQVILIP